MESSRKNVSEYCDICPVSFSERVFVVRWTVNVKGNKNKYKNYFPISHFITLTQKGKTRRFTILYIGRAKISSLCAFIQEISRH